MQSKKLITSWRMSWGTLIFLSIVAQIIFGNFPDSISIWNFFSYFSILSNLLMAFLFVTLGLNRCDPKELNFIRGAVTLYMSFTGLGFSLLLKGNNQELLWWVNILLHYISPMVMLLDWLWIKSGSITFIKALQWLIPPIIYLLYTYIRAFLTNWYPYPFLNPQVDGLVSISLHILGLCAVGVGFIYALSRTSTHSKHY